MIKIKQYIGLFIKLEYHKNGYKYNQTGIIEKIDNYNIYFKINDEKLLKIKRKNINKIIKIMGINFTGKNPGPGKDYVAEYSYFIFNSNGISRFQKFEYKYNKKMGQKDYPHPFLEENEKIINLTIKIL